MASLWVLWIEAHTLLGRRPGVPVSFRPGRRAKVVLGLGFERTEGTERFAGETEPLVRVGFSYALEVVPGNSISPEINVDFVDGEALLIVGATIGWGF